MSKNKIIVAIVVIIIIGVIVFIVSRGSSDVAENTTTDTTQSTNTGTGNTVPTTTTDTTTNDGPTIIGKSVDGTDIRAYSIGSGETEILLVGGIHGGYSPNTITVVNQLYEYYLENPDELPDQITLTAIPLLNPDGAGKGASEGRFNANNVDLNRNFDCGWQASALWQNKTVSGGSVAFSEPETAALRDFVAARDVDVVIGWYSAGGGVFASSCTGNPSAETLTLTNTYAKASGYKAYTDFDFYEITGDMTNWFAKIGVPAVGVLLTDHSNAEFNKNLAGLKAVIATYAK